MLRHSYATRCIEAGIKPVVLQKLLVHSDVRITLNTYTSVFDQFQESEFDKVSNYLVKMIWVKFLVAKYKKIEKRLEKHKYLLYNLVNEIKYTGGIYV